MGNASIRPVLGVNIAAGVAYFALVVPPEDVRLDDPVKLECSDALRDGVRLRDFGNRFIQEVKRLDVVRVGVAQPRPNPQGGVPYSDAFTRASLEVTMMLVLHEAGIACLGVSQFDAASLVGVAKPKEVASELARFKPPGRGVFWNERSTALMVALAVARQI